MGYHENRHARSLLQGQDQFVEFVSADGVEPGGGLVQEQDFGIERQRAGKRHALDHAAGELGGIFPIDVGLQAHHFELGDRHLGGQARRKIEIFEDRKLDILAGGERGEQRALLEQDAPSPLDRPMRRVLHLVEIDAEDFDAARLLRQEAR